MSAKVVTGKFTGKGAAMQVCLGFTPALLIAINGNDAGAVFPVVLWGKSLGTNGAAAAAGGVQLQKTAAANTADWADHTAAEGIAAYAGGDELVYDKAAARWEDVAGNDVTGKYVTADGTNYGDAMVQSPVDGQRIRTPAGFSVGTDAALNANGEVVSFVAIGE